MKVLVTGTSGMVGSILVPFLRTEGHVVKKLVRKLTGIDDEIFWNPDLGDLDTSQIEGFDAVINLAGENIGSELWTEERKTKILESRVNSTKTLCEALASLKSPPKVLLNASAVGFYGDSGQSIVAENSPEGTGFLSHVCKEWEESTHIVERQGIRVVLMRFGTILCVRGGMLRKMLTPFKFCLGGVIGSGTQYISWITIDDVLEGIHFLLNNETLSGPINLVAPKPVTNRVFTHTLGGVLRRPTLLPMPSFVIKALFGQMGEELILASTRAVPNRLEKAGFTFHYPDLKSALEHLL